MKLELDIFMFLIGAASIVAGRKILSEKPDFVTPCHVTDPAIGTCFAKNLEAMFREWRSGIPGLKSIGTIDPLHVKHIGIKQGADNGPISLNMDLTKGEVSGLSGISFTDAGADGSKLQFKMKMVLPTLKIAGDYTLHGNFLTLALNGKGKAVISIDKALMYLTMRFTVREEGGYKFAGAEMVHLNWEDVAGLHFRLDNIFNGDKALEDAAHALLNESWHSIFVVLQPALSETIETIIKDYMGKLFGYLPVTYYFEGV